MSAALRRRSNRTGAVTAATSAPCQMKWNSAHPSAWAAGRCRRSLVLIFTSRRVPVGVEQLADFGDFLGGRPLTGERLEDELRRGSAEGAVYEISDELALRLLLAEPCLVDVRPIGLVPP